MSNDSTIALGAAQSAAASASSAATSADYAADRVAEVADMLGIQRVGLNIETADGYPPRPDQPIVVWRGSTDPQGLAEFVTGVDIWEVVDAPEPPGDTTPPTAPNAPVVVAGNQQVLLTVTGGSDNVGIVGYRWFRDNILVGTTAGPSFTDAGLVNGTAYTYKAGVGDAAGNWSPRSLASGAATPTAGTADTTAPTVPGTPVATAGDATVSLLTSGSTDTESGVASYKWYRGVALVGTTSGTGFTETGLTNGTAYTYTVSAVDAAGNESAKSAASNIATPASAPDTISPERPDAPVAVAGSASVTVTTTTPDDNVGVTQFRWFRGGVLVGTTTGPSFTETGLTNGTSYAYQAGAGDAAGNWSPRSAASNAVIPSAGADTTAPSTPAAPVATAGAGSASMTVTPATDNVGVVGYRWRRAGTIRGETSTPSFTETGLTAGVAVTYTVNAGDAAGNWSAFSPASNSVTPTTLGVSTKVIVGMSAPVDKWDDRFAEVQGAGRIKARRIFCEFKSNGLDKESVIRRAVSDGQIPIVSYKQGTNGVGANNAYVTATAEFLDSLGTEIIVAYHHEPSDNFGGAGQPTVAEYNRRTQAFLPILRRGKVKTTTLLNSWKLNTQESEFTKFLPPASLALMDYCGFDTYQGGTDANPNTGSAWPGTRIPLLKSLLAEMGRPDMRIIIGEYNAWRADALTDINNLILSTKTTANAAIPFVYVACLWNETGGVGKILTGDRLAAFKAMLSDSRRA